MSDAQHYRTKEEVAAMQEEDPISYVLHKIYENKWATEAEIKKIDKEVRALVTECEKFADESPEPEINVMYDSVYEQEDYPFLPHKL
jgi:pyruvate dehydrogenase E1 component alpha subunit